MKIEKKEVAKFKLINSIFLWVPKLKFDELYVFQMRFLF